MPNLLINAVINQAVTMRLPVVMLDETGEAPAVPVKPGRVGICSFAYTQTCGRVVGTFLANLGHRRVAYISPAHGSVWSRNRLAGINTAFESPERAAALPVFTTDSLFAPGRLDASMDARRIAATLESAVPAWTGTVEHDPALDMVVDVTNQYLVRRTIRNAIRPLLEEALRCRDITAWIASDDETALWNAWNFSNPARYGFPRTFPWSGSTTSPKPPSAG